MYKVLLKTGLSNTAGFSLQQHTPTSRAPVLTPKGQAGYEAATQQ